MQVWCDGLIRDHFDDSPACGFDREF